MVAVKDTRTRGHKDTRTQLCQQRLTRQENKFSEKSGARFITRLLAGEPSPGVRPDDECGRESPVLSSLLVKLQLLHTYTRVT